MECLMGLVMIFFALKLDFGPWVWVAIGLFTAFSATSDIAIDAYTIEMLNKDELGIANGLRNGFYRVGMLMAGFVLILSDWISWRATYFSAALILFIAGVVCMMAPKEQDLSTRASQTVKSEFFVLVRHPLAMVMVFLLALGSMGLLDAKVDFSEGIPYFWSGTVFFMGLSILGGYHFFKKRGGDNHSLRETLNEGPMFGALFELLQRPNIIPVIIFILIYKLADTSMGFMVKPFWVDAGFSATEIGLVSVNIGLGLSIAGGLAGGWFCDRYGIIKGIWVLGLLQAVSNLAYAGVAYVIPTGAHVALPVAMNFKMMMYGASVVESFTGGLGSAAFLCFLMSIVNKKRSASEYALLSSIFAFSRSVAGWASGFGAQSMGYAPYFLLTFFLAFPAYCFLPWVKKMMEQTKGWD